MRKLLAILLALVLALSVLAAVAEDEENHDTGDAALDAVRNEDGIGEKELLVASFGTSYNDSRRLTIGAIEAAIDEAVGDYDVRRGFTSQIIIDHVARRDGVDIDSVAQALERAIANGVRILVVQPTHLMRGFEYDELVATVADYAEAFERVVVGEPLLSSDRDLERVADILIGLMKDYDDGATAMVYMGHGTGHASNEVYARMQALMDAKGAEHCYIGTVEAEPSLQDVMAAMAGRGYRRVVLRDMMVVCGDHAHNDMAGDEEDSWKSILAAAGYEVECVLEGLGQVPAIRQLYVEHALAAVAEAVPDTSRIADASEMTDIEDVVPDGMAPVTADMLNDGVYEDVAVESSSSMFRVVGCTLTVKDGRMTALLEMKSDAYSYMYPGPAEEAAQAPYGDLLALQTAQEGSRDFFGFVLPVDALDAGCACAAFSARKQAWYPRTLMLRSDALPIEAWKPEYLRTPESLGLSDGCYRCDVTLSGGGRTALESPAGLTVSGGACTADITFTTSRIDYVIVGGQRFEPTAVGDGAAFSVPVAAFDRSLAIVVDSTAMTPAVELRCSMTFDSGTLAAG